MLRFTQIATACALGFASFAHCGNDGQLRGSTQATPATANSTPSQDLTQEKHRAAKEGSDTTSMSRRGSYRPIFFMHGINDVAASGGDLGTLIQKKHPGTKWIPIPKFEGPPSRTGVSVDLQSMTNMMQQVSGVHDWIKTYVEKSPSDFTDGFNLICHSQGGLICRGVVTIYGDLDVKTFVSLAGPQMGVDSYESYAKGLPQWEITSFLDGLIYTATAQKHFSFASYYKDMTQYSKYQEESLFLARMNNEYPVSPRCYASWLQCKPAGCYSHTGPAVRDEQCHHGKDSSDEGRYNKNQAYKDNFQRLEKAIFVGSSGDGEIVPWASTIWGYAQMGTGVTENKVDVEYWKTPIWTRDLVPLQAMQRDGKLYINGTLEGVAHNDWLKVVDDSNVGLDIYLFYLK